MLKRTLGPLLVFAGGMALTTWAMVSVKASDEASRQASFERLAERTFSDATQRLRQPVSGLGGFRGAAASSGKPLPSLDEITRYVGARDLPREFPGVLGFGVIQPVKRADLTAFEATVRADGDPDFTVKTSGDDALMYVIKGIEPRSVNASAVGFDVGSETSRRTSVERAFAEGRPVVTAPIRLLQDPRKRYGSLLMVPVLASGRATLTGPEDRVVGVVYAAMVYEDLLTDGRTAAAHQEEDWIRLTIVDKGGDTPETVYDSYGNQQASVAAPAVLQDIDYFGRPFRLIAEPTPAFVAASANSDAMTVLWVGLIASLLASLLLRQQGRMRFRAESLAASMTHDLDRLAAVARLTQNAVVVTDVKGQIEWVNPAFRQITGFSDEELIGRKPGDLLQTDKTDPQEIARMRACLSRREPYAGILHNRSKQGRVYLVELEIQPLLDPDGSHSGFIAVESDVTEAMEQRAKLKASAALLDRTGELSSVGGWRVDVASGEVTWSRMTRKIHEVADDYVPNVESGIAFYAPEAQPIISAAVEKGIADGRGWDLELPFITAKGRRRWVRAVGMPEFEDGRLVALDGAFADVTDAVEARVAAELERKRFEMILAGTGAGTWEWNVQTGETRFNERWAEIIGYSLDELQPTSIQTWMAHAHPDDLAASGQRLEAHFRGDSPNYVFEARMRHRLGHWIWVLDRGRVMTWTDDNQPEWMFGTHVDITERKEAELRLAESQALLSTTLHSIGDAVLTADTDGRVTWLNPVAETLTGWTMDEARGRQASEILRLEIEGQAGLAPCPIQTCLDEGRKVGLAGNTVLMARDGSRYVIEDSAAPLLEPDGRVLGAVMVFRDVTEKAHLAKEMSFRATHDALTGLINRLEFEIEIERALERAKSGTRTGVLMFLDLDHFKMVNDACGHAAGDRLLVQIAAIFRNEVRGRDTVARFGGDEFAILLEDCPLEQGRRIGQKIVDAVDRYRYTAEDGRRFRVGVSIGLVPVDARWINLSQVLQSADAACYAAKAEGRSRVVVEEGLHSITTASRDIQWGPVIEQALDEDLFELFAQCVIPLKSEATPKLRCEVLLRLKGKDGKLHGPGTFIPAAERYQLASRIDRWVLRAVINALKDRPLASVARVAINLSGQSVGDRAFHRFALDAMEASGLPLDRLCIEITETAAVANLADAAHFIDDLHALGIQVALDDFGAGSASFGYLKSLKVDVLKIDGQFVRGLLQGELESAAIRSFVDVARVLDLRTVAEQVESEAIATRLTQLGADFGQGYFFHRPEPFADLLAAWSTSASNVVAPSFNAIRRRPI